MNTEYQAWVDCLDLSDDAVIRILPEGVCVDTLFSSLAISFARIRRIHFENYRVKIINDIQNIECSKMGQQCEWFYDEMKSAYDQCVLKAFGISKNHAFETKGVCAFEDYQSKSIIRIYSDGLCILPSDQNARRLPWAFVNGIKEEDYAVILRLMSGEVYRFSMLGRDFEPFVYAVKEHIRAWREHNIQFIKTLDETLEMTETAKAASLIREGLLTSIQRMEQQTPKLLKIIHNKIRQSKMASTYAMMEQTCDKERMCIGLRQIPEGIFEEMLSKLDSVEMLSEEQKDAMRWNIWTSVPSKDGKTAVVEFAFPMEATATYVFSIESDWDMFLMNLNRGMEASGWAREIFTVPENELGEAKNDLNSMLIVRTPAIRELRKAFKGRVIHRSEEQWKKELEKYVL